MASFFATPEIMRTAFVDCLYRDNNLNEAEIDRRRTAIVGPSFGVCAQVWNLIVPEESISRLAEPKHLLYALNFLRSYDTYEVHGAVWKCDPITFKTWAWAFVGEIFGLQHHVIDFQGRFENWNGNSQCLLSVDGTDCKVKETDPLDKGMFSWKFRSAALKYEVAFGIFSGKIAWIDGPHKGAVSDREIFIGGLQGRLDQWEYVETDLGYEGVGKMKDKEMYLSRIDGHQKSKVRARHETVNSRFKAYKCLSTTFRHHYDLHELVFYAIGVLVNLELAETPIWEVDYSVVYP